MSRTSENIVISANDPSLALYRLQEHVRRAAPPTVARRQRVAQFLPQLAGACYDLEYAARCVVVFHQIFETLENSNLFTSPR